VTVENSIREVVKLVFDNPAVRGSWSLENAALYIFTLPSKGCKSPRHNRNHTRNSHI